MSDIRNEELKAEFMQYLEDHPQERFWQSVRNFSEHGFVYVSDQLPPDGMNRVYLDTFYWEGKNGDY